jgi:hypothetical protein
MERVFSRDFILGCLKKGVKVDQKFAEKFNVRSSKGKR